jgi:ABC-type sulfate transport system permease subunit
MRILIVVAAIVCGYVAFAFGGGWLISEFSSNRHDRALEAAMTGAFVLGPFGAVAGLIVALVVTRRKAR